MMPNRTFGKVGQLAFTSGLTKILAGCVMRTYASEIKQFYIRYLEERHELVEQSRVQGVVTYYLNQVLKFRDDIRLGDTIVMPRKRFGGHRVAHGVIDGGYEYWGAENYRHRRQVRWMGREVPRDIIRQGWPLSDRRTVFRIDDA